MTYRYLNGDTKHPYEFKSCPTCAEFFWIQKRRTFCSRRCSKIGNLNPSKQKSSNHGLSKIEYITAHEKVRRVRGKAFGCTHCSTTENRMYHWANISGKYWEPYDYISLCVPCHDRFDRGKHGQEEETEEATSLR